MKLHHTHSVCLPLMAAAGAAEGRVGLGNVGNSCYVNAVVQVLTQIPEAFDGVTFRASDTARLLRNIADDKWDPETSRTYEAQPLNVTINAGVGPAFAYSGEQQDAHQMYMAIVDALRYGDHDGDHKDKELTHMAAAFDREMLVEFHRTTRCHACGTESTIATPEFMLTLPIDPDAGGATLDAAFAVLGPELMAGDDQYACDVCQTKRDATRTTEWARYPRHLVIGVKRFRWADGRLQKLLVPVDFEHRLHDAADPGFAYRVHALVVHYGTAEKGHYVAFGRVADGWLEYNDRTVTRRSDLDMTEERIRKNVYMLVYRRE